MKELKFDELEIVNGGGIGGILGGAIIGGSAGLFNSTLVCAAKGKCTWKKLAKGAGKGAIKGGIWGASIPA